MAKAEKQTKSQLQAASSVDKSNEVPANAPQGFVEPDTTKSAEIKLNPPVDTEKDLIAKAKADQKAKDDAAKLEAKEAKAKAAADKKAAAEQVKADKAAERAKSKAERLERIAEIGATGSMASLADKVKSGVYVKGPTGQLHTNDALANALEGIAPTNVVALGLDLLGLEENPYAKLNVGQQSMNLRNRLRGALKKQVVTLEMIGDYIARNGIHVTTMADIEAAAKAKADKKAAAIAAKPAPVVEAAKAA